MIGARELKGLDPNLIIASSSLSNERQTKRNSKGKGRYTGDRDQESADDIIPSDMAHNHISPPLRNSPVPYFCHQASLEGIIDFSPSTEPEPDQLANTQRIFNQIINHYEPSQTKNGPYKRITLVRLTYEYALSEISRNKFLKYFFDFVQISTEKDIHIDDWDAKQKNELESSLTSFADFLVNNFFLPCKTAFIR